MSKEKKNKVVSLKPKAFSDTCNALQAATPDFVSTLM